MEIDYVKIGALIASSTVLAGLVQAFVIAKFNLRSNREQWKVDLQKIYFEKTFQS